MDNHKQRYNRLKNCVGIQKNEAQFTDIYNDMHADENFTWLFRNIAVFVKSFPSLLTDVSLSPWKNLSPGITIWLFSSLQTRLRCHTRRAQGNAVHIAAIRALVDTNVASAQDELEGMEKRVPGNPVLMHEAITNCSSHQQLLVLH